jgi:hypothetical protein
MAVQVERALDEPMVRFVFSGALDRETIADAVADAMGMLDELGTFYAALDIRQLDATPDAFLAAFTPASDGLALLNEPRIAALLVTATPPSDDDALPTFNTLDDAITFARVRFASRQPGGPLL